MQAAQLCGCITAQAGLCGSIHAEAGLTGTAVVSGGYVPAYYEGTYTVRPEVYAQELETAGKTMKENVSVEGVPFYEVSNDSGTTVNIAVEV